MKTKPILCLDFDGVIHSYSSGWKGARNIPDPPVNGAIKFIDRSLSVGWDVVIFSSRSNFIFGIWAMRRWLKFHAGSLWYESMGRCGLEDVRFVRSKPAALITIDDRAITFEGDWSNLDPSALLKFKPWNKRSK